MFDKLEEELYKPVRELSHVYAIDDPNLLKQFENCVNSFIEGIPNLAVKGMSFIT